MWPSKNNSYERRPTARNTNSSTDVNVLMRRDLYLTLPQYYPMYITLLNVFRSHSAQNATIAAICNNVRNALNLKKCNFHTV